MQQKLGKKADALNFTTQPVAASWGVDPEFVDLTGLEARWGIRRSLAYVLIKDGSIKSVCLRRRGQIKGKRLVNCASVTEFLNSQPTDVDHALSEHCRKANRVMQAKREGREKAKAEKEKALANGQ
jgi:hypothetical protein